MRLLPTGDLQFVITLAEAGCNKPHFASLGSDHLIAIISEKPMGPTGHGLCRCYVIIPNQASRGLHACTMS